MTVNLADILRDVTGFDWDEGNRDKSLKKHSVSDSEAEQIFFNFPQIVFQDLAHSQTEDRYTILSTTNDGRDLIVTFTKRDTRIRIISARDQKRGVERDTYKSIKETA